MNITIYARAPSSISARGMGCQYLTPIISCRESMRFAERRYGAPTPKMQGRRAPGVSKMAQP